MVLILTTGLAVASLAMGGMGFAMLRATSWSTGRTARGRAAVD